MVHFPESKPPLRVNIVFSYPWVVPWVRRKAFIYLLDRRYMKAFRLTRGTTLSAIQRNFRIWPADVRKRVVS